MRKVLITAATFRPFETEWAKLQPELKLANTVDDRVIDDLIPGAVEAYEKYTNNILLASTWDLFFDAFPDEIETPGPLSTVSSVKYLDTSGVEQTLATTVYKVTTNYNPLYGLITLKYGQSWESTYAEKDVVYIRFVAGYANSNAIPLEVKRGLLLHMSANYYGLDLRAAYESKWDDNRRIPI